MTWWITNPTIRQVWHRLGTDQTNTVLYSPISYTMYFSLYTQPCLFTLWPQIQCMETRHTQRQETRTNTRPLQWRHTHRHSVYQRLNWCPTDLMFPQTGGSYLHLGSNGGKTMHYYPRLFHAPTRTISSGCFVLHRTIHGLWNLYGNPFKNRAEKEKETVTWFTLFHVPTRTISSRCLVLHRTIHGL